MRFFPFLILIVTASGCVFPSDIDALKHAQDRYQYKVDVALTNMENGKRTIDQTLTSIGSAISDRGKEIDAVKEDIRDRIDAVAQVASSGLDLLDAGGLATAITIVGGVALNVARNRSREKELGAIVSRHPEGTSPG